MSTRSTISVTSARQLAAEAAQWITISACMLSCCLRLHAVIAGAVFVVCIIGAIYACPCRRTSRKDEVATEFNGLWKARVFLQLVGALWAVSISCCAIADVTAAAFNPHVSGLAGHSMLATRPGCMHCCRANPRQLFAALRASTVEAKSVSTSCLSAPAACANPEARRTVGPRGRHLQEQA